MVIDSEGRIEDIEGYTTKEVAEKLGTSISTLKRLLDKYPEIRQKGWVHSSLMTYEGKTRKHLIWSEEAVKYTIKKLPSVAKEWKESIKNEFMDKGFIITKLPENGLISDDLLEQQMIQNLELFKRYKSLKQEQNTIQLKLTDTRDIIIKHMQEEQENRPLEDPTWKILRNYIKQIHEKTGIWLWTTINRKFGISSLKEGFKWRSIKQKTAETIIEWIEGKYKEHIQIKG